MAAEVQAQLPSITPQMDRRNASIFLLSWQLLYFAAPVIYVGVVQAGLCDKLGASATVANLPAAAFLVGGAGPILVAWRLPLRWEGSVVVWSNVAGAISLALVSLSLILPVADSVRIAVVIGQGLIFGILNSISGIYMFQCLGRGTTHEGRAKALKWTFTLGPIVAVAASLGTQFILNRGISALPYPYDFAFLYFLTVPCLAVVALLSRGYRLLAAADPPPKSFLQYIGGSIKSFTLIRALLLLWIAYFLWFCAFNSISNISLYTKEAIGRDPKELSGAIMALRFGFKAAAGFVLGMIALRWGERAPILTAVLLLVVASIWAWGMPGYLYLLCFGLMGAAELGAAYFINFTIAASPVEVGARNLSLLQLAVPASSLAPPLYGAVTDALGFRASFILALIISLLSLWATLKLPFRISRLE